MKNAISMAVLAVGLLLGGGDAEAAKKKVEGVANLNTATAAELRLLPGVGDKGAQKIIALREKQKFTRIEELTRVKGIGKKKLQALRPHLSVTGPSTIKLVKVDGATAPPAQARKAPGSGR
jgi:competence protein ComEA